MIDWIQGTESALRDLTLWRFFVRILSTAVLEEAWHYAVIAMVVWATLHVVLKRRLGPRLIGQRPNAADIRREIAYSVSTVVVFACLGPAVLAMIATQHADIYQRPLAHGLAWLLCSFPLLVVWQDFYFYWTHRLLHTRWLFRHVHAVHHRSRHPSPWAAYSFHPIEALNNSAMLFIALAAVPVNETVLAIFVLHQIVRNAHGHAAYETMPGSFVRHRFWGRFTTTTHHHLHHETARGNYGLWFTYWDRLCGTERQDYFARFDATCSPNFRRAPVHEMASQAKFG